MRQLFLALVILAACSAAHAGSVNPLLRKYDVCGRFEVFHINGIMTDRADAQDNLAEIAETYGNGYREHVVFYGLAYNQTRGFPSDFYDSVVMVLKGYAGVTWDMFLRYVTFGTLNPLLPSTTAKAIAKTVGDMYGLSAVSPYQDEDLAIIMAEFNRQTETHARIVFVPHSQGNQYMNLVYDKLIAEGIKPKKSLGVVGIAVPWASVRSGNTYITSANDFVIDASRLAVAGVMLSPNVTIPYQPTVDILGHNLRDIYLANTTVRSKLKTAITNEFAAIKTTAPDPDRWLEMNADADICGDSIYWTAYPPDAACWESVPDDRTPAQWHKNVIINSWSEAGNKYDQRAYGTGSFAELDAFSRAQMAGCYAWYVSDRKSQILKFGHIPTSGHYYPVNDVGGCGYGFPWATPYANPDIAWVIYSADSSKLVTTNTTYYSSRNGKATGWGNKVHKLPLCNR